MRPPLTPIETGECEPAAQRASGLHIDSERPERLNALRGEVIRIAASRIRSKPAQCLDSIVQHDAQCARHVVITGPGGA